MCFKPKSQKNVLANNSHLKVYLCVFIHLCDNCQLPFLLILSILRESAKLERIAAELVLAAAVNTKKSASPPPLTAEEFYRQQKMLRLL